MAATDVSRLNYSPTAVEPQPTVAATARPVSDLTRPRACDRVLAFVDQHRWKLYAILAVLYLLGFNGAWRPEPDSALYLTIGRNIAQGEGYTYHGASHRLVFPGMPLIFAGLFKVFGTASVVPHQIVMLAMGIAALALIYRIFLLHAGRPMAVLITLLVGVCQTFYRYNFELLSDLPFMLGVMAFLAGYEGVVHRHESDDPTPTKYSRGKPHALDWALLLVGLVGAVVTRPTMMALLLAVAGAAMWPILRGRFRWGSIAVFIIVILAVVAFYAFDPREGGGDYERMLLRPDMLKQHLQRALEFNLPKLFEPTVAEAVFAVDFSNAGNILISAVLILTSFSLFRAHALWGLLVVMTGCMLVAVEVHVRYLLFILPLLIYAWFRVLMWIDHRLRPEIGDRLFAGVLILFIGTNVARDIKIIIEQRTPNSLSAYKSGKFASLPDLAKLVREHTEPNAWILVRHKTGRILTFMTGRYAVEPNAHTQLDVTWQPVYVLDPIDSKEEDRLDTRTRDWMTHHDVVRGDVVGSFKGKHDREPWVLSRREPVTDARAFACIGIDAVTIKISIVTPSYNGVGFLDRTAQSILTQAGDFQLQWLVVDGGSTDGTLDLLKSIHDPRLQWISEPDRGQSHAVNRGLGLATGDIIGWLNTDDLYTPDALQAVANAFAGPVPRASRPRLPSNENAGETPAVREPQWLIGRCQVIDANDQPIRESVTRYKDRSLRQYSRRALLRENFISQPAVFWRRDFGQQIGPLDETLNWTMDYDLWLRMATRAEPLYLDKLVAQFRLHATSKTGQVDRRQFDEQYAVASRYFGPHRASRIVHRFNVEKIVWAYRVMRLLGM